MAPFELQAFKAAHEAAASAAAERLEGLRSEVLAVLRDACAADAAALEATLGAFASGGKDATQRATEIWKRALTEYEQPPLDPAVLESLDAYIARRREAIGGGEP